VSLPPSNPDPHPSLDAPRDASTPPPLSATRRAELDDVERRLRPVLEAAGAAALARFRHPRVQVKADGSKVTDADLAAQDALLEGLSRAFPGEAIRSEEDASTDPHGSDRGVVWWVDPLDGTGAFTEGLAYWGPTASRFRDGVPDVGGFWVPRVREWWFAGQDGGAWRDGERLWPGDASPDDANAIVLLPSHAHRVGPIGWRGRMRGLGSAAAHLALVAAGGAAATVLPTWQPWDIGCGLLLVREAGRTVVDLSGRPTDPMMARSQPFLAAAPGVVPELTAAIRTALTRRGT
jgi:myo-inositol-1(or 4)-monophosphatase